MWSSHIIFIETQATVVLSYSMRWKQEFHLFIIYMIFVIFFYRLYHLGPKLIRILLFKPECDLYDVTNDRRRFIANLGGNL
jgi:hypothetical protein